MSTPTSRTLAKLREEGWTAQVVERWIQTHFVGNGIRQDLFGGIDIVACRPLPPRDSTTQWEAGVVGIQACSDNGGSMAAHRAKLLAEPRIATWIASGARMELWAWSTRRSLGRTKAGKRSKRLVHHLRREEITLAMFVPKQASQTQEEQTRGAL